MTERKGRYVVAPRLPKRQSEPRQQPEPTNADTLQWFRLELPPTSNHQYEPIIRRVKSGKLAHGKRWSDAYQLWRDKAALVVQGWEPPAKTPLAVLIHLFIPSRMGRHVDISGFVKALEDAVVGAHRDQWIDWEQVVRLTSDGEGHVNVIVGPLKGDWMLRLIERGRALVGEGESAGPVG